MHCGKPELAISEMVKCRVLVLPSNSIPWFLCLSVSLSGGGGRPTGLCTNLNMSICNSIVLSKNGKRKSYACCQQSGGGRMGGGGVEEEPSYNRRHYVFLLCGYPEQGSL